MNQVYFSPGNDCKNAIIKELNNTTESCRICVFTISDNDITDAIQAAYHRGVRVTIITDNDKMHDKGSDIHELYRDGIEIRVDHGPSHMHHKFAIFDRKRLITGSFNWTRSASKFNQENIILTDNKELVSQHLHYYDELWEEMKRFF